VKKVLALLALLLAVPAVHAVLISLSTSNVEAIGGTGLVDVRCPTSGCTIGKVEWGMQSSAPYYVEKVLVTWTPAATGSYTVYVNVYDNADNILASGSATVTVQAVQAITTTVTLSSTVNPKDVYKVEVIILENL